MNVATAIVEFRDEADDQKLPYLWKDADVIRYLNQGQIEAARRARLFLDADTPAVCTVKFKAGNPVAKLDPRVIYVREARVIGRNDRLWPWYRRDMECDPGWRDVTGAYPERIIRDYGSGKLRIYPAPTVDVSIALTVVREPLDPIESASDEFEVPARGHWALVHWALHRAFSRRDSGGDARDDKLAAYYLKRFEEEFGPPMSLQNEIFEQQNEDVLSTEGGSY